MTDTKAFRKLTKEEIVNGFPNALNTGHIYVCYRVQVDHATGCLIGAEALMRWEDPVYGPQYPGDFVPVLEAHGLIYTADLFVFQEVCRFIDHCRESGSPLIPISVNMSRYDVYNNSQYVEGIEALRRKYDIPIKLLRIEITESSAIGGTELISSALRKLHDLDYIVEMDDFGSGYSSLSILKALYVDVIKFDMTFFDGIMDDRGKAIIRAMVQLAKSLNVEIIAEGVETKDEADFMQSIGCNYIQGFLYGKPVSSEDLQKRVESSRLEPNMPAMDKQAAAAL